MAVKIAELAARFASRAPAERAAIEAALDAGNLEELANKAHKLAGISEMVGYADIGSAARTLEDRLDRGEDPLRYAWYLMDLLDAL